MSVLDERNEFMSNDFYNKKIYEDFSYFYVTITICTIFAAFLFILNIYLCCSRYSDYWNDSNTGNRWIAPIWSKTPYQQPPIDYTELEKCHIPRQEVYVAEVPSGYFELSLQKRESDL